MTCAKITCCARERAGLKRCQCEVWLLQVQLAHGDGPVHASPLYLFLTWRLTRAFDREGSPGGGEQCDSIAGGGASGDAVTADLTVQARRWSACPMKLARGHGGGGATERVIPCSL